MSAPRIGFVIGGVQKGGTTALAQYLASDPRIALPKGKEAHVFDAPDYDDRWAPADIDARYAAHFEEAPDGALYGDATPIYCFHPACVRRIAAYNPAMRWVLLLRHPVERAVSQYYMERSRGDEPWPFWPAMLLERWRLQGHQDDFSPGSPLRHFSYRARGDYARQLDVLFAHFPREQVLLLRNEALAARPGEVLEQVLAFLGLRAAAPRDADYARVFAGQYPPLPRTGTRFRVLQWLMGASMRRARQRYGLEWT